MAIPERLKDIVPILKDSYRGVDIRAVLAKSKSENRWYYTVLKIRLTQDTAIKIQEIHDKKENELGSIDYDDFKVVSDSIDIQQLDTFLNGIQNGSIKLNRIIARPRGTEFQNIFDNLLVVRNGMYSNEQVS
jgi:hypothetical protein